MRVLIIKTSSMGDLIHTFPALTDAGQFFPQIEFDWVVEENFKVIPSWHPLVNNIIPVALRRWRKTWWTKQTRQEWLAMLKALRVNEYDYVIDAQGLVKSAILTFFSRGKRIGLDWYSARESLASVAYQEKRKVNFYQHAIVRMRQLFSLSLGYPLPSSAPDAGLSRRAFSAIDNTRDIVFLPGTTWTSKAWPESYWITLANQLAPLGFSIKISGGNDAELAQARRIASVSSAMQALPRLSIAEMADLLANAVGVVGVDTGFTHLAAAIGTPTVAIYGATNPAYTGAFGKKVVRLAAQFACSPCLSRTCTYRDISDVTPACYATVTPDVVCQALQTLISSAQ